MSAEYDVDLAVIGSGGAAMAAGIAARKAGAEVVLIERGALGGTCVNVGCIPSKTLLAAAGTRHSALTNPFDGVPTSADGVDLDALVAQKAELIDRLKQHKYTEVAEAWGFPLISGEARFADKDTVEVDGKPLRARSYVIATGSQPTVRGIDGIEDVEYLTSTTAMELTEVPESLVIIGGGYVGMEQAQLFAANPDPRWVAPPGQSLHRLGTELDLGPTSAYGWLAASRSNASATSGRIGLPCRIANGPA